MHVFFFFFFAFSCGGKTSQIHPSRPLFLFPCQSVSRSLPGLAFFSANQMTLPDSPGANQLPDTAGARWRGAAKLKNLDLQEIKLLSKAPLKRDSANVFRPDLQETINKSKITMLDLFLATACVAGFTWPRVTPCCTGYRPSVPWGHAPGMCTPG